MFRGDVAADRNGKGCLKKFGLGIKTVENSLEKKEIVILTLKSALGE